MILMTDWLHTNRRLGLGIRVKDTPGSEDAQFRSALRLDRLDEFFRERNEQYRAVVSRGDAHNEHLPGTSFNFEKALRTGKLRDYFEAGHARWRHDLKAAENVVVLGSTAVQHDSQTGVAA